MHWVVKQKKKNWNLFIGQNSDWWNLFQEWMNWIACLKINHYVMLSHKHVLTRKLLRKQSCHRNQENRVSRGWLSYQLEVRILPSFKFAPKNCSLSFFKGKFNFRVRLYRKVVSNWTEFWPIAYKFTFDSQL